MNDSGQARGLLGPKGQRAALDIAIRASRDYADMVPRGDQGHTFTLAVVVQGEGANYAEPLMAQEIRAYSLAEALVRAIAVPFPAWFPEEDD